MKALLKALVLFAGLVIGPLGGPARADPVAIQSVIEGQITAFRADDFDTAFGYAAPGIRQMFGTPQNFGTMVRQGYPMVWRPGLVEFLQSEEEGGTWRQDVLITDAEGRLYRLAYAMVETPEGWKIAAVQVLTEPDVGA